MDYSIAKRLGVKQRTIDGAPGFTGVPRHTAALHVRPLALRAKIFVRPLEYKFNAKLPINVTMGETSVFMKQPCER